MLRVVDTSAWIEWLLGSNVGLRVGKAMPPRDGCVVPTLVQFELSKWLHREHGEEEAARMIAYTRQCLVVDLDTRLALLAADLHRAHGLATADAVVYATARQLDAELLSCDSDYQDLPGVIYVAKTR